MIVSMRPPVRSRLSAALLAALALSACSRRDVEEFGRAPSFSPVGDGIAQAPTPPSMRYGARADRPGGDSLWDGRSGDLFRDRRATRVGDVVTIVVSIDDKASLGATTDRSRDSKIKSGLDIVLALMGGGYKGDASWQSQSSTSTKGGGKVNRSEKIQLSLAGVVTDVLPNGNLMISGSQEMRVDYEMRVLTIAGIVRPRDISRENSISYDKIAEARVSYGGRGRISEIEQPGWGQQLYDRLSPM
jgi:flagellar L-ring protein precursor FlgH